MFDPQLADPHAAGDAEDQAVARLVSQHIDESMTSAILHAAPGDDLPPPMWWPGCHHGHVRLHAQLGTDPHSAVPDPPTVEPSRRRPCAGMDGVRGVAALLSSGRVTEACPARPTELEDRRLVLR